MSQTDNKPDMPGSRRIVAILMWFAVSAGFAVSIGSLVEELCMATACSDAASFVFFGISMGIFGCIYFGFVLMVLCARRKKRLLGWLFTAMIFSGVGAEFRLLWIQKYIIGSWCPLCVTICCALVFSAALLVVEKVLDHRSGVGNGTGMAKWLIFAVVMAVAGLAVAMVGVRALS